MEGTPRDGHRSPETRTVRVAINMKGKKLNRATLAKQRGDGISEVLQILLKNAPSDAVEIVLELEFEDGMRIKRGTTRADVFLKQQTADTPRVQ